VNIAAAAAAAAAAATADDDDELRHDLVAPVQMRMPSGMLDSKRSVREGGIRNYLAVQGPGVAAGVTDSTLLSIIDILPVSSIALSTVRVELLWTHSGCRGRVQA
jgi:hypothetical protein